MPLRVAFLASECEPWAKTGGLADVVDALARALGHLSADDIADPVDVFLPRYRTVPAPDSGAVERRTVIRVPDPRAPTGTSDVTLIDVAADGYRLRLVDHPPAFDRDGLYGDAAGDYADNAWRFGLFCRAALEALRADGTPVDVLHLHDWHTGPAAVFRDARYADDPIVGRAAILMTLHNLAYHGWVSRRSPRSTRSAAGRRCRCPKRRRAGPAGDRDRAGRAGQHGLADLRGRGADPGLRDGPRWVAALEGGPVLRHPQRTRHDRLGPGDRRRHRGDVFADGPVRQGRLPSRPARAGRVRPGRRRDGVRDDRPTRSAEGLRPRGRCRAGDARARRADRRPGQRPPGARGSVPPTRRFEPGPGRAHRTVRPGHGAADLCRRRRLPDALAVRAVRPGPDDRPALRDAAGRPPDRRPRGHGRRRGGWSGAGTGFVFDAGRPPSDSRRHAIARWRCMRPGARRGFACSIAGWRSISTG